MIIIGGGPAGLSAAMYASRYKMKTLVVSMDIGGQMATAHLVENYPGYKSIGGMELMDKFREQVEYLGTEIKYERVVQLKKDEHIFSVKTDDSEYQSYNVLLAAGLVRRKLNITGEQEFFGSGVSYCATCDGAFFRDKIVAVVGGGDAAGTGALLLSENAKKVYLLVRSQLRAEPVTQEQLKSHENVEIIYDVNAQEIKGDKKVTSVLLDNGKEIPIDGIFIEIGGVPSSSFAKSLGVKLNERNEIVVNELQQTNIEGFYAAGDITNHLPEFRQAVISAASGATAAFSAFRHLKKLQHLKK